MTIKSIATHKTSRRFIGGMAIASISALSNRRAFAHNSTPTTKEWTYTDVLGTTVTLPDAPVRIAANIVTAAALLDLGD